VLSPLRGRGALGQHIGILLEEAGVLGVRVYSGDYLDACRARVDGDVASYRKMRALVKEDDGATAASAIAGFETTFFNNMVLVLDQLFVHRLRTVEGKDGNALNEVRVLCESMLNHGNVMTADKAIKLTPAKSVLKYEYGDEIRLDEAAFVRLAEAFFTEMQRKFS
jgi:hypothetical protein